jgi:AcrR family transcriptional regulator
MRAAGANPAAVHHRFGSRQALAEAVLERTLRPLNGRRLELLERAEAGSGGGPIALGDLLDALVRPDLEAVAELAHRAPGRGRLIGTIYSQPERFVKALVERHFEPVAARFVPHLVAAVPWVPPAELAWRVRWCVFGLLGALLCDGGLDLDLGAGEEAGVSAEGVDRAIARIVAVTAGAVASQPGGATS